MTYLLNTIIQQCLVNTADTVSATFKAPNGIFFQPGKYDANGRQITLAMGFAAPAPKNPDGIPRVGDAICSPTAYATTNRRSGRIFLCPSFFKENPTVPPSQNVAQNMRLDDYFSASRILVHELVHLWNESKCPRR